MLERLNHTTTILYRLGKNRTKRSKEEGASSTETTSASFPASKGRQTSPLYQETGRDGLEKRHLGMKDADTYRE
jgi:hypothetical protein